MFIRSRLYLAIMLLLLVLGAALFIFLNREQEPDQTYPATVDQDCAPWDGPAFTISVQYDPATMIYISIWKSPDIKFPSKFVLPDHEEQVGNAYTIPELDPYTILKGEVVLQSVSMEKPIEGWFSFTSEKGELFEGRFLAKWGNQIAYCG